MAVTPQDLANAELDIDTIGEFVNGSPSDDVTNRAGATFPSLRKAISGGSITDFGAVRSDGSNVEADAFRGAIGSFPTRAAAIASRIGESDVDAIRLDGYAAPGDGGGSLYKRVVSEPSHAGKFQSVDGQWWELGEPSINVRMFGAIGDGVADDTAAIQAAIAAVAAIGRGTVFFPAGTYAVTQVNVNASNITLLFDQEAVVVPKSATNTLFYVTFGWVKFEGGYFENASSFAQSAIMVNKAGADNSRIKISNAYFSNFVANSIQVTDGDNIVVRDNTFINGVVAVRSMNNFLNCTIDRNFCIGCALWLATTTTQQAEGVQVVNNCVLPAMGASYCINIEGGLEIQISSNVFDQIITGNGVNLNGISGPVRAVKIVSNWIGRQAGAAGADYGLYISGNTQDIEVGFNTLVGFRTANIYINGTAPGICARVKLRGNNHYSGDVPVIALSVQYVTDLLVSGDTFNASASTINENTGVTGIVENCLFISGTIPNIALNLRYRRQSSGVVMNNKGTGSLTETTKLLTINHGLSYQPAAGDFQIVATDIAANAPGEFYVSNITATQAQLNCRNNPGVGGCPIAWYVDITR